MKKVFLFSLISLITVTLFACPMDGKAKEKSKTKGPNTVQTG